MDDPSKIKVIKLGIVLFEFVGESKISTTRKLLCFRIFNVSMLVIPLWLAFVNFFFVEGEMYNQALQSTMLYAHVLLKYLSFLINKANIQELLNEVVNRFWNHRRCSRNIVQETEKIHALIKRLQNGMLIICAFGVTMYMMKPLMTANRGLLLESFIPHSNVMTAILLFSQFYYFIFGGTFVLGYDFTYFGLCADIVLQFRLLKHKMQDALGKHDKDTASRMNVCVQHHQFLFTVFWRMQNVYSTTLLFHYVGTLISTCTMFLELSLRRTNFMNDIAKIFTVMIFAAQFGFYAFPAEQVAFEFSDFANAIYESIWYENTVTNQRILLNVMVAAQRGHYFSGAGLVNINVGAFESVFRKAFSFCAIFRNLIQK